MPPQNFHKQLVTFTALAVLFLGSFFYLVVVAFDNARVLERVEAGTYEELLR